MISLDLIAAQKLLLIRCFGYFILFFTQFRSFESRSLNRCSTIPLQLTVKSQFHFCSSESRKKKGESWYLIMIKVNMNTKLNKKKKLMSSVLINILDHLYQELTLLLTFTGVNNWLKSMKRSINFSKIKILSAIISGLAAGVSLFISTLNVCKCFKKGKMFQLNNLNCWTFK